MPCKFCTSSSHTLAKCNSPLGVLLVETVYALVNSSPFKLREQAELLKSFTVVQLSVVCRSIYGTPCNGTKNESIAYIIGHFFGHLGLTSDAAILVLDQATTDTIDQEYDHIVAWFPDEKDAELRRSLLTDMDIYYARRYGIRRYGYPIATFHDAVQYLLTNGQPAVNSHLKKLSIAVTVTPNLPVEDCCCCLDEKQMSLLGCGHSCCSCCLTAIAKKRTKSFLLCPLCRAEIQTLQVVNDAVLKQMNKELISC